MLARGGPIEIWAELKEATLPPPAAAIRPLHAAAWRDFFRRKIGAHLSLSLSDFGRAFVEG